MLLKTLQNKLVEKQNLFFLFAIIFLGLIPRIYFLFAESRIIWDSAVYIGLAKYIFSLGSFGIWESLRPPIWPLILGFFWKFGIDIVWFRTILQMIFSSGSVGLVYLIGEKLQKNSGLISAGILYLTPFFIFYEHYGLTEIPAVFFSLLAVYLFMRKKWFFAGLISAVSFLTKFPMGLVFFSIILVLIYQNLFELRKKILVGLGFIIPLGLYLISNWFIYGSIFEPFLVGSEVIKSAAVWLYSHGWKFYFTELIRENFILLFSLLGAIYFAIHVFFNRKSEKGELLILVLTIFIMSYFIILEHKEIRFAILFLPYLTLLAGYGIVFSCRKIKFIPAIGLILLVLFLFSNSFFNSMILYDRLDGGPDNILIKEYYTYLNSKSGFNGEVLLSDPLFAIYSNISANFNLLYYPLVNEKYLRQWNQKNNLQKMNYVFLNSCDLICAKNDYSCEIEKEKLLENLKSKFDLKKKIIKNNCEYFIYSQNRVRI